MSADTFGGICKLKDGYRICFGQAPDNLVLEEGYEIYVARYFGLSETYATKEDANAALNNLYKELEDDYNGSLYPFINEYGTLYFCFNELSTDEIDKIENEDLDNYMKNL